MRDEIDEAETPHRKREDAGNIQPLRMRVAGLLHTGQDQAQRNDRDRRVDEEDPLPVGNGDDHAANDRTEAESDAEDDSPSAKRLAALTPFLELMRKHGHLADQHRATAHPLKKPADDQDGRALREPADQRGDSKHHDAGHIDAFAPEAICQRPSGHQHRGTRERIGVHDPLDLLEIGVQHAFKGR